MSQIKSSRLTVLLLAWCIPNISFAQTCLGADGVSGITGGVTRIQNGNVCANQDLPGSPSNGAILQVQVGNVFQGDFIEYRINWNDGSPLTAWLPVPSIGGEVCQVNSAPHFFPTTSTNCEYTPSTYIRVNGVICNPGTFGIAPVFFRWNNEGSANSPSSNFVVTSVASVGVADGLTEVNVPAGVETTVTFQDLSNFNCNTFPGDVTMASNRNNTRRWRQYEYGGAGNLNSITGGVTVGSLLVLKGASLQGPLLTYSMTAGAPAGNAGGTDDPFTDMSFGLAPNLSPHVTEAITIPATAQEGEVFVVTTHFWNGCNRADEGFAPIDYNLTKITVGSVVTSLNDSGESKDRTVVYPNPVYNRFSISTPGKNGIAEVRLYDQAGRRVFESRNVDNNAFDVQDVPSGVYVLEVKHINGRTDHFRLLKI